MEKMDKLRKNLCRELEEIANKSELSAGDLQVVHTLTDTIKNLDKIEYLEGGEYSGDMSYTGRGSYTARGGSYSRGEPGYSGTGSYGRVSYDGGNSYGRHYVRAHYSRDDGMDMMIHRINEMIGEGNLSQMDREALQRAKDILMT